MPDVTVYINTVDGASWHPSTSDPAILRSLDSGVEEIVIEIDGRRQAYLAASKVVCLGCGSTGVGPTPEEAWARVPHEGHGHRAEEMPWHEARQAGQAEEL